MALQKTIRFPRARHECEGTRSAAQFASREGPAGIVRYCPSYGGSAPSRTVGSKTQNSHRRQASLAGRNAPDAANSKSREFFPGAGRPSSFSSGSRRKAEAQRHNQSARPAGKDDQGTPGEARISRRGGFGRCLEDRAPWSAKGRRTDSEGRHEAPPNFQGAARCAAGSGEILGGDPAATGGSQSQGQGDPGEVRRSSGDRCSEEDGEKVEGRPEPT